jgi:5-bromo-4-chloroindolyl phosphate hydrolysis protein
MDKNEEKQLDDSDVIELNELKHDEDLHFIRLKLEEIEHKIIELQNKLNGDNNEDAIKKLENSFNLMKKVYETISKLCCTK